MSIKEIETIEQEKSSSFFANFIIFPAENFT